MSALPILSALAPLNCHHAANPAGGGAHVLGVVSTVSAAMELAATPDAFATTTE
jgi:hypothetical protein